MSKFERPAEPNLDLLKKALKAAALELQAHLRLAAYVAEQANAFEKVQAAEVMQPEDDKFK